VRLHASARPFATLPHRPSHALPQDGPLPIGYDQTISAPHMHAYALDRLAPLLTAPDASILDVGAGSGYLLAVFAHMCPEGDIRGIEVVPELVAQGNANLERQPVPDRSKIRYEVGDGWEGLPGQLFDAIHVGAAAEKVPEALVVQLKKPGRMIVPIGPESFAQQLVQVDKDEQGKISFTPLLDVQYVPLVQHNADFDITYVK